MASAESMPISSRSGRSTNYLRSRVPQMFRSVCLAGLSAINTSSSGSVMSRCSPRNVIVAQAEQAKA